MKIKNKLNINSLKQFCKFCLSSGSSFLIDLLLFQCFIFLQNLFIPEIEQSLKIWIATICARVLSSLFNYMINKIFVFSDKSKVANTMVKYYILCIIQMCCSALLVSGIHHLIIFNETIIKFFVDILLFLISYQIQNKKIFKTIQ